jgi:Fic family protein
MKLREFESGEWVPRDTYRCFRPSYVNHEWSVDDDKIVFMLSTADRLLGELNVYSTMTSGADLYLPLFIQKEVVSSARLNGAVVSLLDSLKKIDDMPVNKVQDWNKVDKQIAGLNNGLDELLNIPLCSWLLTSVMNTLTNTTEYRDQQIWKGGVGVLDATYIPPHPDEIPELMSDLESFLKNKVIYVPPLIKLAISKYQLMSIMPYRSDNETISRLLIPLFLINEGILEKPVLYLSHFFMTHHILYTENITRVRQQNDISQWILYFLQGVIETAENAIDTYKSINFLRNNLRQNVISHLGTKSKKATQFLALLMKKPVIDSDDVAEGLKMSKATALRFIYDFVDSGILMELTGFKRNRIFVFDRYLGLFK